MHDAVTMTVTLDEFYYLFAAAGIFLALIIAYNALGGRKKKKA